MYIYTNIYARENRDSGVSRNRMNHWLSTNNSWLTQKPIASSTIIKIKRRWERKSAFESGYKTGIQEDSYEERVRRNGRTFFRGAGKKRFLPRIVEYSILVDRNRLDSSEWREFRPSVKSFDFFFSGEERRRRRLQKFNLSAAATSRLHFHLTTHRKARQQLPLARDILRVSRVGRMPRASLAADTADGLHLPPTIYNAVVSWRNRAHASLHLSLSLKNIGWRRSWRGERDGGITISSFIERVRIKFPHDTRRCVAERRRRRRRRGLSGRRQLLVAPGCNPRDTLCQPRVRS